MKNCISKINKKKILVITLCFLIPLCLMTLVYVKIGIFPFGEKSLLTIDMHNQYISFFSYFKEILQGNHEWFYSFSKGIGGGMIGLVAYYLMSPFNLLFLFFDTQNLPMAILVITLLKIGTCGLSMGIYLNRKHDSYSTVVFSACYAMMAYNIVYQQNIMWIDGVILLPIICMGIELMFENKTSIVYIIALFASIITNYYIGFMLCIFSVLFFCYNFVVKFELKNIKNIIGKFFFSSLAAGGLSAFLLIPVVASLQGGKAEFSLSNLHFIGNFNFVDLFSKMYPGAFDFSEIQYGLPNLYCGCIVFFFVACFFLSKNLPKKDKIAASFLLGIILVSMHIQGINLIWHGLNAPIWFPYRYSFMFCFCAIILAWRGFQCYKEVKRNSKIVLVFVILISLFVEKQGYRYLSELKIYFAIFLVLMILLSLKIKKQGVKVFLLLGITSIDLIANASSSLGKLDYYKYDEFNKYIKETVPIIEEIKNNTIGFFRMETTSAYDRNDPMLLNYNGVSHYSSTEKEFVKEFLRKIGFNYAKYWVTYNSGSTVSANSLLGIKYILSEKNDLNKAYQCIRNDEIKVYENPYSLPIGFMVSDEVRHIGISEDNTFQIQNKIWSSMAPNIEGKLFEREKNVTKKYNNVKIDEEEDRKIVKIDADEVASIYYEVEITEEKPLYMCFPSDVNLMKSVEIIVDGESKGEYLEKTNNNIIYLGNFQKGEKVSVEMKLKHNMTYVTDELFYYEDIKVLEKYYTEISKQAVELQEVRDSYLKGTIIGSEEKNILLLTVPYDKAWNIKIDGKSAKAEQVFECFLAVEVPRGKHMIELQYHVSGIGLGIAISVGTLIILMSYIVICKRHIEKKDIEHQRTLRDM